MSDEERHVKELRRSNSVPHHKKKRKNKESQSSDDENGTISAEDIPNHFTHNDIEAKTKHVKPSKKPTPQHSDQTNVCFSVEWTGRTVIVTDCCLTENKTDAIVNAANGWLRHGSGIARTIVTKGGSAVVSESNLYILKHGKIECGDAAVTGAGKLPALYVIHAVGPRWKKGSAHKATHDPAGKLRQCIRSSLEKAHVLGVKSIAIPSISSGKFGGDIGTCADLIVQATFDYFAENPESSVKIVHLNAKDDDTRRDAWIEAIKKVMDTHTASASSATTTTTTTTTTPTAAPSVPTNTTPKTSPLNQRD